SSAAEAPPLLQRHFLPPELPQHTAVRQAAVMECDGPLFYLPIIFHLLKKQMFNKRGTEHMQGVRVGFHALVVSHELLIRPPTNFYLGNQQSQNKHTSAAQVDRLACTMKEENLFRRRFSLCPTATSPPKIDPHVLTRNLSYGGDNELSLLSPGNETERNGLTLLNDEVSPARSPSSVVDRLACTMKEENLFRRRFSLCPTATSPPKIDPHVLTRNLSYGGDNELSLLSPGNETERNGLTSLNDEVSPARSPSSVSESRMFIGLEKESSSPTEKLARKESLKVQKQNYRQEKKRVAKELFSALKDPSVVIMSNWLKIRGTLKSWTKLWCILKPGILLIYKTPGSEHWVGTILLNACKLIERPSKKDGFCFKLYHPLDKSLWAMKARILLCCISFSLGLTGPKGETVGSITQPLPSNYLIFRAASESDGRCWMDALELALSCSSLSKMASKSSRDGDVSSSSESSHILQLLQCSALADHELLHQSQTEQQPDAWPIESIPSCPPAVSLCCDWLNGKPRHMEGGVDRLACTMKEENLFRRRFSLCPTATSPPKIDPHVLTRNLSYGGDNELSLLSPGNETERNGLTLLNDEVSPARSPSSVSESRMFIGLEKESSSPTEKLARKESLKVQKQNYRQEKKRVAKELFSALKDPSVVIMSNWLKIRGTLKSWTKLWCILKPGILLIYKTPGSEHWVGTILLNACKLIERPSKKDGFCFKLYHPLDKSLWAMKARILWRCWMDALELALSCSSLSKMASKSSRDGDVSSSSESSHILQLLQCSALADHELLQLNDSMLENNMENDANSDKSERDVHEDSDNAANERGLTEESDMDQSDDISLHATTFVEEAHEEMGEAGEASQVETVSEENKGLIWTLLKQLRPGMDLSKVGLKKPYNPILGETFRCCWLHPQTDSCTFYIAEQVSHHPPVSAFYISNKKDGFSISGSILAKSKFYGNSLSAILDGKARLLFLSRDEEYIITMPYAHCKGILYGTMTLELGGKITIECEKTQCYTELEFKLKPFLGSSCNVNQISGKIRMGEDILATVDGHWDNKVLLTEKKTGHQEVLWNPGADIRSQRLKRRVVTMDQQEPFESQRLWRHVTRAITDRDQNRATLEKSVLEEAQRQEARDRAERPWNPRLFSLATDSNEWHYKYDDTKPWDPECCLVQFEKDGVIQTKEKAHRQRNRFSYSQDWPGQQKVTGKHRKSSSQPSSCSQNTESSSTTPEPNHESSDNEGFMKQCARCTKEVKDIALIEASVAAIQKTQQDIQRQVQNLSALGRQIARHKTAEDSKSLSGRHCLILCMLLLVQLLINYVCT
ncbi:hypothetical protein DNTS_024420, partial [Danionella cerebrum]